jgi:hypothetical protein
MFKSDRDFSGKIDQRFYCENRIAIEKPDPKAAHRREQENEVQTNLFNFLRSECDFFRKIDQRFLLFNRDPIFIFKSRSRSRSKTVPEKSLIDFHVHIGSRIFSFQPDPDVHFLLLKGTGITSPDTLDGFLYGDSIEYILSQTGQS